MNKRSAFLSSLLFLVFAISLQGSAEAPGTGATAIPDHVTLTWTGDPATTMTVTWRADPSVTSGIVQFQLGEKLTSAALSVKAEARDFTTDLGAARLFTATLGNLTPGRKYSYRVGDGERWNRMGSFSTAERNVRSFKFLVFGDSQAPTTGNPPYNTWRNTLHNAYNANPDARFIVNVGDLVDFGQRGAHWNAWFDAAQGVIDRIPEMPATGNHESYGSRETTKALYWLAQFALPQNGPEGLKGQAYSYDYGPVHFVVLDSQQDEQKQSGDILTPQQTWLDSDLAASKARWKIVFFHRPPYGAMAKRPNDAVKAAFSPILEKHHVDLVFNAHDHAIARSHPIRNGEFMKNPSQGVIYYLSGQSGGKTYRGLEKMPWHEFFHDPQDQPNYFVLEATDRKIVVKTVKQDGTVLDEFTLDKGAKAKTAPPQPLKKAA